ncbi:MAG: hypothetical protein AVDCRST_MAG11-3492, partial [uncultured Gemmatimonadaceae bacterium]
AAAHRGAGRRAGTGRSARAAGRRPRAGGKTHTRRRKRRSASRWGGGRGRTAGRHDGARRTGVSCWLLFVVCRL